jgi:hypothetical protein
LAPDHSRWIDSQRRFFLPVDVLSEVFRGKFVEGLKELHANHNLGFQGTMAAFQNRKAFAAWLRPLFRSKWVVYSKRPFGGAQHALRHLSQYTRRVAISNHRLVALADRMVTFRWRGHRGALLPLCIRLLTESGRVGPEVDPEEKTASSTRPL